MNDCMLDFFEGIEQDVRSSRAMELVQSRLNTGQAAAVAMTRSLPHGLGIVQGPPGTGKTFMISNLVQPLLFTSEPRRGPSVLILSTSNLSVDDITMRVKKTCAELSNELSADRVPVVARVHAGQTESSIVRREADLSRPSDPLSLSRLSLDCNESDSTAARALADVYNKAHHKPFGVEDKRLRLIDSSLGALMLNIANLPPHKIKPEEGCVVECFRHYHCAYGAGKLDEEGKES